MNSEERVLSSVNQRVQHLETLLASVLQQISRFKRSLWVPIDSFAPEPYEVLVPLTVVVAPYEDEFEASFFEGNLHATGDTEEEAIQSLKGILLDAFDRLLELSDEQLGPAPLSQKRTLMRHIRRRSDSSREGLAA